MIIDFQVSFYIGSKEPWPGGSIVAGCICSLASARKIRISNKIELTVAKAEEGASILEIHRTYALEIQNQVQSIL
jgi:hypothetical protein